MTERKLRLINASVLSSAMEHLRRRCFLGEGSERSSCDEFDLRSRHIVVVLGDAPVAQIRATLDAPFAVKQWSNGAAEVPDGSHVAELTRANVAPEYRGLGLSGIVFREALRWLASNDKTIVVGAEEPALLARTMYRRLGYEPCGPEVSFNEPIGLELLVQPLLIRNVPERVAAWRTEQEAHLQRLRERGYELVTEG